jgi:hypothetical protein
LNAELAKLAEKPYRQVRLRPDPHRTESSSNCEHLVAHEVKPDAIGLREIEVLFASS